MIGNSDVVSISAIDNEMVEVFNFSENPEDSIMVRVLDHDTGKFIEVWLNQQAREQLKGAL